MGMNLNAISLSRDGKWIVCGTMRGANVWDAELQRKVVEVENTRSVWAVDASPELTRFATAVNGRTSIWSITTGEKSVDPLEHNPDVSGIKFSPEGGHIASACVNSIHIFDSYNGDQLRLITIENPLLGSFLATPVVWPSHGRFFALSVDGNIKSFDFYTGSQLAEWQIHGHNREDTMSLTANNRFIACSAGHSVSFWDTSTHTQLGGILQDVDQIRSIALSPDGTHLATGGLNMKITIWNLTDTLPESYLITVSTIFPISRRRITFIY